MAIPLIYLLLLGIFFLSMLALWLGYRLRQLQRVSAELNRMVGEARQDRHDARHDFLTGCLNRRGWHEFVEQPSGLSDWIQTSPSPRKVPGSLAMVDLDQFKRINDSYGHGIGDQVLVEFSKRLIENLDQSSGDVLARLGGEEFSILSYRGADELSELLLRFNESLRREPIKASGREITLRFCAGVAEYRSGESTQEWMNRADQLLYQAKFSGGRLEGQRQVH